MNRNYIASTQSVTSVVTVFEMRSVSPLNKAILFPESVFHFACILLHSHSETLRRKIRSPGGKRDSHFPSFRIYASTSLGVCFLLTRHRSFNGAYVYSLHQKEFIVTL